MASALVVSLFLASLLLLFTPALSSQVPASIQIQNACNATRHPDLCASSLTQSPNLIPSNPTTNDLILASISLSINDIHVAKSAARAILNSSAPRNVNRTNVASNCIQGLTYSYRRLSAVASSLRAGSVDADTRAWASAAMLYHHGCWSGLKNVNNTIEVAYAILSLSKLTNLTSNALSMVAALQRYGSDTSKWAPLKTERDGYWGLDGGPPTKGGPMGSTVGVPSGLVPNVTVCKEGVGCTYRSVQAAVEAAPVYGKDPFVIHIKQGVYEEIVRVAFKKTNVVLIGDGMGKTVITGSLNVGMLGLSTYSTATVGVVGDGFMAANLTIRNTAGPDAHQAVAFRSDSDCSILENVEFVGHQDTLYARALRQLYRSCVISGTVDFIFGDSAAVFENSHIIILPRQLNPEKGDYNTVTAQSRVDPAQSTGFVFYKCVVNGSADYLRLFYQQPAVHRSYLGRPWREYSRTVFIECFLGVVIRPEGWFPWSGDFALSTLYYGEFKSGGPGGNVTGREPWSNQIPEEHLYVYSVQNFIQMG